MSEYIEELEKDLKKFVEEYYIEYFWRDGICYVCLRGGIMDDFSKILSDDLFDEGGIEVIWCGGSILINMTELNEMFEMNLENVFPKK